MPYMELLIRTAGQVGRSLLDNWPFLVVSAVTAAALELYVGRDSVGRFLHRHRQGSVLAATGAAVATPLCSCGTTAVILGMMAGSLPWAPIVAFMVASPLTSPGELFYSAGLFGWPFAGAFFASSILLGLLGGLAAHVLDGRGWLAGQARFRSGAAREPALARADSAAAGARPGARALADRTWRTGRRLLVFFLAFAFVGTLLNGLIPAGWVTALFGSGRAHGVPLAATLGLPLYVNTEASLPLVKGLLDGGMSPGAALAFLITGAGTSVGAVAGTLTIARWRVVALVAATLWVGAMACGYGYDALLRLGVL